MQNNDGLATRTSHGEFNYLSAATEPSLFRNARVMMNRDSDGNTAGSKGIDVEAHTMTVHKARLRPVANRPTCAANGFELHIHPLIDESLDFLDHAQVVADYYGQCEALVERASGARAYAFDHNVRSASGK